jgi:hypothetical protein
LITSKVRDLSVIRIIEIIFIILSSYGFFLSVSKISYFELNENQVLYLYSTGAQVIAGLFGLTLAGYIFFNDRLEKEVQADESLYDAVETLKKDYYRSIKKMGVMCICSVAACMANIAWLSNLHLHKGIHIFLLNQTVLLLLMEIFYIVDFVIKVADPNKILKLSNVRKHEIDKEDGSKGDLAEFLKYYNMMEDLITSNAQFLISSPTLFYTKKSNKDYKPQILQSLKILNAKEILNIELMEEVDELRRYRNYTVHSSEPTVTNSMCQQVKQLYDEINNKINQYFDSQSSL